MKKVILFIALIAWTVSCSDKDRPDSLLSEDRMVNVLVDIHMAEGISSSLPVSYDSSKKLFPMLEYEVYKKHEINDSIFRESLQFYLRDAGKMEELYSRVIDSLNVREKVGD